MPVPWSFSFELALMDETGWSWDELQNTPVPVVMAKAAALSARNKAAKLRRQMDQAQAKETAALRKAEETMNRWAGRR